MRSTLFLGCLLICHFVHAFSTPLRLHSCGNARTRDCGALTALACARCPLEPHLIPQSSAVAKSSNPRAHKTEVHYRRGTLEEYLVGKWSHSPDLPFPQHAHTNTFPILNPSCRFLNTFRRTPFRSSILLSLLLSAVSSFFPILPSSLPVCFPPPYPLVQKQT